MKIGTERIGLDAAGDNLGLNLEATGPGVFDALFSSFSMILVTEVNICVDLVQLITKCDLYCSIICQIGDETFIIAALMAMRHPKATVLSGALSALFVMTVSAKFI